MVQRTGPKGLIFLARRVSRSRWEHFLLNLPLPPTIWPLSVRTEQESEIDLDVMIVDDSAAIRKILRRVLAKTDVPLGEIYEASDGVEALQLLATNTVGLILCDINMPNMDGIELVGTVRAQENLKAIPFVMVTTEGSQAKVMQAIELGAAGYVKKPFTPDQIKEKLTGII